LSPDPLEELMKDSAEEAIGEGEPQSIEDE